MLIQPSQTSIARPLDLTCQVCEEPCANEEGFFRHIHREHADYWRVFSGGRPLEDFVGYEDQKQHVIADAGTAASPPRGLQLDSDSSKVKRSDASVSSAGGVRGSGRDQKSYICTYCRRTFVQVSRVIYQSKQAVCYLSVGNKTNK